ncbi:MAG: hypothetical protein ACRDIC_16715, partial [bacterium]
PSAVPGCPHFPHNQLTSHPGSTYLVALINDQLAKDEHERYFGNRSPTQMIERIYWSVSLTTISRVLDVVRTTLVELVAEMRAGTPAGQRDPSQEAAEHAAQVAIYGNRNQVVVNQMSSVEAGGNITVGFSPTLEPETRQRKVMWWIVGIATIVAAGAAVWVLFI